MELRKRIEGNCFKVWLGEKFLFSDHEQFRAVIDAVKSKDEIQIVHIYLNALEFLDSSALGMLLLMRDVTDNIDKKIVLYNPQGQVKKLFEISCFYDLFQIENDKES